MKSAFGLGLIFLITINAAAQQQHFDGKSWRYHVEMLAADNMEGRRPGSPGLQRAEAYVVDQLQKSGLAPAGTDGYYQPLQFESRQVVDTESSVALVRNGKAESLTLGEDAFFTALLNLAPRVEAPLAFVGYGLKIPEKNYDDFDGLDLKGKVAVTISGVPEGIDGPLAAHYLDLAQRWHQLRDAGMIGWIIIQPPGVNWSRGRRDAAQPVMHLSRDQVDDSQLQMWFNPAHADKLFEGTDHTPADLFALAKNRKALPHFILPARIRATARMLRTPLESANVIAKLEGSDPALKNEYVVLSAHIDHLGIGEPINGDAIYNGAVDNASGCALLLDIAAELKKNTGRPRRSVLFVFFTEEEDGKLGSKYFTERPTVDRKSIVADLNIDEIDTIVPLKAIVVFGLDESDLGAAARRAAATQNIPIIDPEPGLRAPNAFTEISDQQSFIAHGIPALIPKVGFPGELGSILQEWRRAHHHQVSDDLNQPVNLETAAKFEEIMLQLLLDVAKDPHRPEWKSTSFYKRYAKE